jgi:hypothetical protein
MKGFVVTLLLFMCTAVFGGNVKELIAEIESRTLIVVLETTIKSKYDKLDYEGKVAYSKAVENYNRKMKEVTGKFWTMNKVEFKNWDEVDSIFKKGSQDFILLFAGNYSVTSSAKTMEQRGLIYYREIFSDNEKRNYRDFYTSYNLTFIENREKAQHILSRSITSLWPLKEDMIFVMQNFQCLLKESKRLDFLTDN